MNLNQIHGILTLTLRQPQVLSIIIQNLTGRLTHRVTTNSRKGWIAPPEQITIMTTDGCNLHCKMCHFANNQNPGYQINRIGKMPMEIYRKLMDEVPGYPIVSLTGGEPLLHPEVVEMVAYAKHYGRFCSLTTNGWMLEKYAQELCDANLDVLVVSVDGPQEIHDHIRGARSFEHISSGLDMLLSKPRRPIVFVNMSISNLNFDQMVTMFEMAQNWRVDSLNFNHLWFQTPEMVKASYSQFPEFEADEVTWGIDPGLVDTGMVADQLDIIRRRSQFSAFIVNQIPDLNRKEIATWYREPERFVKYTSTRCAWIRMKVWPDGSVKPCRQWEVGNVMQTHALEVWNGNKFQGFRRLLAERDVLPICARCCYLGHR
jgi:MoaA/NifB/PqqE/SkfB family radical SAM enzyme